LRCETEHPFKIKTMAISNEIFEHYRAEELKINQAIQLLRDKGYNVHKEDQDQN